ncbi:MAG: dienelactone hydrolase family protein [Aliidongia sp.]
MTTITIDTGDGKMNAYVATPKGGSGPALVVIQEIFGVNQVMRDLTDGFAAQGFVAICPDLFWRIEPGIDITDKTQAEWARAFQLFQTFDVDKGLNDIAKTITAIRQYPGSTGKVGAVGYCLGVSSLISLRPGPISMPLSAITASGWMGWSARRRRSASR